MPMKFQIRQAPQAPRLGRTVRAGSLSRALAHTCVLVASVLAPLSRAEEPSCPAPTIEQARALADRLSEAGQDESAGKCYEAAGEYARANQAFLNAVTAQSKAAERQLAEHLDGARKLARQLERALRGPPRGAQ